MARIKVVIGERVRRTDMTLLQLFMLCTPGQSSSCCKDGGGRHISEQFCVARCKGLSN